MSPEPAPEESSGHVTKLLLSWRAGDEDAREELFSSLYGELRRLASIQVRDGAGGATLQPTALVSEAYLRMIDAQNVDWQDRAHFLSLAVRVMRRVLVERARYWQAKKRGAGRRLVTLKSSLGVSADDDAMEIERVDAALETLARIHPRQARVTELRFFGGLEVREVAVVLGVSQATVKRDWSAARLWLYRELRTS